MWKGWQFGIRGDRVMFLPLPAPDATKPGDYLQDGWFWRPPSLVQPEALRLEGVENGYLSLTKGGPSLVCE